MRPLRRQPHHRSSFTLMELLVALALSLILLRLILPLVGKLARPQAETAQKQTMEAMETWSMLLEADLSNSLSPSRSSLPVVRLIRSPTDSAFDELEIQSLCRPGEDFQGPLTVRYVIEPARAGEPLALVRYGRGWYDNLRSRHVLAENVQDWKLDFEGAKASQSPAPSSVGRSYELPPHAGCVLLVTVKRGDVAATQRFWIRGQLTADAPTTQPATRPAGGQGSKNRVVPRAGSGGAR